MGIAWELIFFLLGLILLVWGSNLFVDSAVLLAERFHLPEVLIGATIVSLGTTLPETIFSATASLQGLSDMALGNALGSILCNTGFIAAFMLLMRPICFNQQSIKNMISGMFFLTLSFLVYVFSGLTNGGLSCLSGWILLLILFFYLSFNIRNAMMQNKSLSIPQTAAQETSQNTFGLTDALRMPFEIAAIYSGANLLVTYGPLLAKQFGVPDVIISLTFVALGTSLPELMTSLMALKKQHSSLSLGNIIGADFLNLALVGGLSAVIHPLPFSETILTRELPFLFIFLALLCLPSIILKKAGRLQGLLLISGYAVYLFLISRF